MVLTAIEMGYFAGILKALALTYLIETCKANLNYLRKQQYGTASAYGAAYNQVFR